MTAALTFRRMLIWCLLAAALLFAGAGHASAAQVSRVAHRTAVHHRPVAYADGSLTLAGHSRRRVPVARLRVRTASVTATTRPLAYADGLLTGARHRRRSRHLVRRTA
jgi:hypothetical protein